MAQSGQLRGRVSEEQLIGLLEQVSRDKVQHTRMVKYLLSQAEEAQSKTSTKKATIVVSAAVRLLRLRF